MEKKLIDFDLAEDMKALLSNNIDVRCKEDIKEKIFKYDNMVMLKVTKKISFPMEIINVEEVTEDKF